MQCPQCNAPLDDDTIFCGNCGKQIAPLQARGATISVKDIRQTNDGQFPRNTSYGTQGTSIPAPGVPPNLGSDSITFQSTPRPPRDNTRRLVLIVALILLVIAGGTIGVVSFLKGGSIPASNAAGFVKFLDSSSSQGKTDALQININGLPTPPSGSQYNAWLVDDQSEHIVRLGILTARGQTFTLNHAGSGTNLLRVGNKLEITLEQGTVNSPTGRVVLTGVFPPKAFVHIRHLLVAFPTTPGGIGLLVGLQRQAQLLNAQAQILQSVVTTHNSLGIQCVTQSMLDIIEGKHGAHYRPLSALCALQNVRNVGDGFGILGNGYLALAASHASLAATQPDATDNIRLHAGHVEIAVTNIKGWVTTVDQDLLALLANPGNTAKVQEIVTLADHSYNGVDTNGDEHVDPVPGEAGAQTAYQHGQLMATLPLQASNS
jgi:hypothetical protein